MFAAKPEEPDLTFSDKCKMFMAAHWRGVIILVVPLILLPIVYPDPKPYNWTAYALLIMAVFWVTEAIPLAVTGFLPMIVFPFTGILDSVATCSAYINDAVMIFLASLFLAYSIEQSGLHKRLAYFAIRTIGYSHIKLLLAMCIVTTFVSMWITNTAATSMMVPILFALLNVFEMEGTLNIYDKDASGNNVASDITSCYFCGATFSATIGGIGTLVGTATNLAFKSLFEADYPSAPEYLSFPNFCAFAVPYMILLEFCCYMYLAVVYFGLFRPNSAVAKRVKLNDQVLKALEATIAQETKKIGTITFWEMMVVLLFGTAIFGFFCRSPQIFPGWGDLLTDFYGQPNKRYIKDSAMAMFVIFLMFILPSKLTFFENFSAKVHEQLPKSGVGSVLNFMKLNAVMPYSFMFLLGGGVALARGARISGLNDQLGNYFSALAGLPNMFIIFIVILVVIFVTNFASNVAVINVFGPILMTMAMKLNTNPLWYIVASGFSASYCFVIAVGTPGNLVVKVIANIPTIKMMKAGIGPTVSTLVITWFAMCFWAPVIWPDIQQNANELPWAMEGRGST